MEKKNKEITRNPISVTKKGAENVTSEYPREYCSSFTTKVG